MQKSFYKITPGQSPRNEGFVVLEVPLNSHSPERH
jgi:hypothetical protein